jgi:hypothetical protein
MREVRDRASIHGRAARARAEDRRRHGTYYTGRERGPGKGDQGCQPVLPGAGYSRLWHTSSMTEIADTFDSAFTKAVDLGNRLADRDKDADLWDIADGLLAGALQYWLYSRQPCGDPRCQDCMPISTAEGRMAELKKLVEQLAAESEYFHTPTDANAGRA